MKKISYIILLLVLPLLTRAQSPSTTIGRHYQWAISQLNNKATSAVLVTAHRCDWRNAPENSVQALNNAITMGADIAEFDIGKTKDGQLVIMHDKTIDRTTTGKGKPGDYTFEELKQFKLKSGTGHPTIHTVPTLDQMLDVAKGKIILNIDKGYDYYDQIIPMLKTKGMTGQIIYNIPGLPLDSVKLYHTVPDDLTLQLIINPEAPDADKIIASYKSHPKTIIQIIFSNDQNHLLTEVPQFKKNYTIWFNSLWAEQNGGHDDDKAVEENQPDETWGWLIKKGANILQTDRPKELLAYLKKKKLHQ